MTVARRGFLGQIVFIDIVLYSLRDLLLEVVKSFIKDLYNVSIRFR